MATAIDWFNIKTGETVYTSRPAQIKGLIESSDLGVNRQSDVGWRLGKEWVAKLRKARNNREMMANLGKMSGGDVTDTQLLVAIFSIEAEADKQTNLDKEDAPFEQEYLESIKPKAPGRPKNNTQEVN